MLGLNIAILLFLVPVTAEDGRYIGAVSCQVIRIKIHNMRMQYHVFIVCI